MANRQIFQHEEDLLINDECKLLEDDTNNKTKMFKLVTLKNFIGEFIKEKIPSWEYGSLKTKGKNLIESANEIYDTTQKRMVSMEEIDLVTEEGFFVDALAVKELNRKLVFLDQNAQNSSVNGWTLIRNGNIVTFKHNKVLSGVIAGHSYSNQGKIPEGYRPAIDITLPGDRIIGATITGSFYVSIGPAGNTNFVSDGNHNENQSYVASGAYITSDLFPLNDIPKVEI
ncbi:MAG: hypothetical protein ACLSBC_13090 [[Clostridium] scindens]|uniref:hypothetical protein n=1 Tax=Clostridium scindens (strain JCM 10418 / VPI 12708) TaxID=29347 RepID=UPI00399408F7